MSAVLPKESVAAAELLEPVAFNPIVRAIDVTRRYGSGETTVDALRGVSLDVAEGELVAVMGPSGSGKSTLMHILAGLDQPTSGSVTIAGRDITKLNDNELTKLRRAHIGFVFQFFNLVSNMTVADNVELAALMGGATRKQARLRRDELLAELGLSAKADAAPVRLSGGEQQRVALARAMANRPSLLLADEPTGNLDSGASRAVLGLLSKAHADGQAILVVTHDARVASAADRVISLFDGGVIDDVPMDAPAADTTSGPRRRMPVFDVLKLRG
jgi:putative ABC transport system ATP-binding protein